MKNSKVSYRYAEALFREAKSQNKLDEVMSEMDQINNLVKISKDFRTLLNTPIIVQSKKMEIFSELFQNRVSELVLNFIVFLAEKGRENLLPSIYENFTHTYNLEKGLLPVTITSAENLSDELKTNIIHGVEKYTNKKVIPNYQVDSSLIGGITINIYNWVYDASLKRQLQLMHEHLLKGIKIKDI